MNRWMTDISYLGSRRLNELTIPGTHDSGTWQNSGNAKCQSMSLRQQLDAGIRFIDIRLEQFSDLGSGDLELYHGVAPTGVHFEAHVLPTCRQFLADNPGETIIMLLSRNTHVADAIFDLLDKFTAWLSSSKTVSDDVFARSVDAILRRHADLFLPTATMPTLDGARGRIVLATRYPSGPGIPLRASTKTPAGWPDNGEGRLVLDDGLVVTIQDVYGFGLESDDGINDAMRARKIARKWSIVRAKLESTARTPSFLDNFWPINYTSATGSPAIIDPHHIAMGVPQSYGMNQNLRDFLARFPKGPYGTVVMDFPEFPDGGDVIKRLIDSNR